jgi:hypothetical protein
MSQVNVGQVAVAALVLYATPAMAQEHAGTQSAEVYGVELFGDALSGFGWRF